MSAERWRQVERVYEEAAGRQGAKREAYLAEACAGDPELRREVERMLSGEMRISSFLETPAAARAQLSAGARIGPYEVISLLGAGGMGEVYKAHDPRLNRTVAIKVLPAYLAADADRRKRLLREARAASALNHPNIITIYDVVSGGGQDSVVMEYVEGPTLGEVMGSKPMPVSQALQFAMQIADGLAAAHAAGVVHRDIKPSNILILRDSQVKVCDFGLAKLEGGAAPLEETRTLSGTVVGTAAYMSPEQATGLEVDHRTDIFSFGVVLYEMLAGRRPFEGNSPLEAVGGILHREPAPLPELAPRLREIVAKLLEKNRDERYQNAAEIIVDLRRIVRNTEAVGTSAIESRLSRRTVAWGAASVLGIGAGLSAWRLLRTSTSPGAVTVAIPVPDGAATADPGRLLGPPVISPDGSAVVVSLKAKDGDAIFLRRLNSNQLTRLEGTNGGSYPFWSPDSRHIAFFADGKLKRLAMTGGGPVTVCEAADRRGGAWGTTGTIVFGTGRGPLYRVAESGGSGSQITELDKAAGENSHRYPVFLPDGDRYLYFARSDNLDHRGIYLDSLSHKQPRRRILVADGQFALGRNPSSGRDYLLTQQAGKIVAQGFRADRGELSGESRPLLDRAGQVSVSDTGILVLRNEKLDVSRLVWQDRTGQELGVLGAPTDYWSVILSRDDRILAAVKHDYLSGRFALWAGTIEQGLVEPLSSTSPVTRPVLRGSTLFYVSIYQRKIFRWTLNPRGTEEVIFESTGEQGGLSLADVSPDQRYLVLILTNQKESQVAWVETGSRQIHPMKSIVPEASPQFRFSPDGGWLAYVSNITGNSEVYAVDFPRAAIIRRISSGGGKDPQWGGDGKEIFYLGTDDRLMSVEVERDKGLVTKPPKPLFRTSVRRGSDGPLYAVAKDGQRFLIISGVEPSGEPAIEVILNWPGALTVE